jgi:hypothetical protein
MISYVPYCRDSFLLSRLQVTPRLEMDEWEKDGNMLHRVSLAHPNLHAYKHVPFKLGVFTNANHTRSPSLSTSATMSAVSTPTLQPNSHALAQSSIPAQLPGLPRRRSISPIKDKPTKSGNGFDLRVSSPYKLPLVQG